MQKSPRLFILLIFTGIISCEKEYSYELGTNHPVSSGDKLVGIVLKDDLSENRFTYQYNAASQILNNLLNITSAILSGDINIEATRDAAGLITKSRIKVKTNLNPAGDTLFYTLFRNASGKVSYVLLKDTESNSITSYDSLVYAYTSGKLSGIINYFIDKSAGTIEPFQKFEFTYTGSNVSKAMEYDLLGSLTSKKLVETLTLEYDTSPAALALGEDEYIAALIPANLLFPCINNVKKYERKNEDDPTLNSINTYNYVYGSNGKPASAAITTSRVGLPDAKGTMTFTYQ